MNPNDPATTISEATSIAWYEYWYRNYQTTMKGMTTAATTTPLPQNDDQVRAEHANMLQQQLQMQYYAMLYAFQEASVIDPINMQILQEQQQLLFFPNDSVPISAATDSDTFTAQQQQQHLQSILPRPSLAIDGNDQMVDDFFQQYPHCGRHHPNGKSAPSNMKSNTTRRYPSNNNAPATIHTNHNNAKVVKQNVNNHDKDDDDDLCDIVEPQHDVTVLEDCPQSPRPPQRKPRTKAKTKNLQHNDHPTKASSDDFENISYRDNQKSNRQPPNCDGRKTRTNDIPVYENPTRSRRRSATKQPSTTAAEGTTTAIVNPFQTARELAETHVFYDDVDNDGSNDNDDVPHPRTVNRNNNWMAMLYDTKCGVCRVMQVFAWLFIGSTVCLCVVCDYSNRIANWLSRQRRDFTPANAHNCYQMPRFR